MEIDLKNLELYNNTFEIAERKKLVGEMLLALRTEAKLTQSQVAEYVGIKAGTYSTYENGTRETPAEIIVRLSLLYGQPTDLLLQRDRFDKQNFIATKQIENMKKEIEELKEMAREKNNEFNPQFNEMLIAMTEVFSNLTDKLGEVSDNIKPNTKL